MTKTTPSDFRPQTSDLRPQTSDFRPQTSFLLKIIFLVACRQEILEEIFGKNLRT